ncbi:MAG: hypothetical protein SFY81_14370 [Verrucomicrobiota bacterium]|nr:hypothetical protein [Verrucomicrobiota bacterium]
MKLLETKKKRKSLLPRQAAKTGAGTSDSPLAREEAGAGNGKRSQDDKTVFIKRK